MDVNRQACLWVLCRLGASSPRVASVLVTVRSHPRAPCPPGLHAASSAPHFSVWFVAQTVGPKDRVARPVSGAEAGSQENSRLTGDTAASAFWAVTAPGWGGLCACPLQHLGEQGGNPPPRALQASVASGTPGWCVVRKCGEDPGNPAKSCLPPAVSACPLSIPLHRP